MQSSSVRISAPRAPRVAAAAVFWVAGLVVAQPQGGGPAEPEAPRDPIFNGHPAWSPDGRTIAFDSNRDGSDDELYLLDLEGKSMRRLTDNDAHDRHPYWSPDGNQIAFASNRDGDYEIYIIRADGSGERQITDNDHFDGLATWTPDGRGLVLTSRPKQRYEIHQIDLETRNVQVLVNGGANAYEPVYANDGRLVYRSDRYGPWHLYLRYPGRTRSFALTPSIASAVQPWWFADGRRVLFYREGREGGRYYSVDTWSGRVRPVSRPTDGYGIPSLSPDGRQFVFMKPVGRGQEIFVYDLETHRTQQLTFSNTGMAAPLEEPTRDLWFDLLAEGENSEFGRVAG